MCCIHFSFHHYSWNFYPLLFLQRQQPRPLPCSDGDQVLEIMAPRGITNTGFTVELTCNCPFILDYITNLSYWSLIRFSSSSGGTLEFSLATPTRSGDWLQTKIPPLLQLYTFLSSHPGLNPRMNKIHRLQTDGHWWAALQAPSLQVSGRQGCRLHVQCVPSGSSENAEHVMGVFSIIPAQYDGPSFMWYHSVELSTSIMRLFKSSTRSNITI